ncbi:type I inositol polyphosphate 5-phosphatase 2-like isoform X2 [Phragmites australis]|uniref:type I inositol polyphosphate 5-phosphatase 2-like isoform X2 n=1 Tax=Phragmites australis TaxID=29695 RepID=UPI002D790115|nr:type I inositol polyphosphate 5-phosphatase 2-like isoform X2 [Phragmites australis]
MRAQRRKQSEPFWPSMVMRKWLNIKSKLKDFSEDEFDTEGEDNDGSDSGDDSFFEIHGNKYMISKSSGEKTIPPLRRLQRRKSENLRVNYISNKDVRVMIGTWNVAGRTPNEDLDLDQWLCTQEPADIFQEVVPLSAGNVLGAEDSRPIRKWEAIIRRTLNKSQQPKAICKSYSAPLSPLLGPITSEDGHEYTKRKPEDEARGNLTHLRDKPTSISEFSCNWLDVTSSLDWPEHPLDTPSNVLVSGAGLRRVMSLGLSSTSFAENPRDFELEDVDLQVGIRRQYHSSGNLGMLWSEQQEKLDVLNSLDRISDLTSEEDSPSASTVEECATLGKRESSMPRANYVRIVSKQMVGIYVSVWVSRKLRQHVNNLEVASVGVGLLGYMGNKGSISISMSLFQTRLCFVCSHLASGHKSGDQQKRNSDVDEILQRTRFSSLFAAGRPQKIPSHDRIFWFGDLNYRIDLPDNEVRRLVAMKRWDDLLKSDQLTKELISGSTFVGWKEGLINFPPTYKYERNSSRYVGEIPNEGQKKRSPAWCDRILWLGKGTKQLSYWSSGLSLSDHRPVSSLFLVEVEVFDQRKIERVLNFTNPGFVSKGKYYMTVDF